MWGTPWNGRNSMGSTHSGPPPMFDDEIKVIICAPSWKQEHRVRSIVEKKDQLSVEKWLLRYFQNSPDILAGLVEEHGNKLELIFGRSCRALYSTDEAAMKAAIETALANPSPSPASAFRTP